MTARALEWLTDITVGEQVEANAHTATFRAERTSDGRKVLVKTVKPGLRKHDRALALLSREREVVEAVDHACLPTLLATMREPDRMALIYADRGGHRLSDLLDRVPRVAPLSALAIAAAVSGALAMLHRAGYVHGRLRSESIELTPTGRVTLHDPSGVGARGAGGDPDLDAPENMAPEQVLGRAAGPETDIYLLGRLLYQLVTGSPPFAAATGGITQQIRHAEPPTLSTAAPDAPRELQAIVTRCLRKRGRDRYPDMASLESELLRALRARTSLASEHLVVRALADAGLATELAAPRERAVGRGATAAPPWLRSALVWAARGLGAALLIGLLWYLVGDDPTVASGDARGIVKRPALVRVLARPWAEIHIDGELVDVTPVGFPIEVTPGRHEVVFKHPNAPDITKNVEIIAGQTVVLDVDMDITRPPADAGTPDAQPHDAEPTDAAPDQ